MDLCKIMQYPSRSLRMVKGGGGGIICYDLSPPRCTPSRSDNLNIKYTLGLIQNSQWVIPEKIHTPMDGMLEILTGGGGGWVEGSGNLDGRRVFGLGNPGGRGRSLDFEIWVSGGSSGPGNPGGRRVKKSCHPSGGGGGVRIFSGITQCAVPENIHTHPEEGQCKFQGGGGLKSQIFYRKV